MTPQAFGEMRALLRRQVRVTLSLHPDVVQREGRLVELTDEGDFTLVVEDGTRRYGWPALKIEALD